MRIRSPKRERKDNEIQRIQQDPSCCCFMYKAPLIPFVFHPVARVGFVLCKTRNCVPRAPAKMSYFPPKNPRPKGKGESLHALSSPSFPQKRPFPSLSLLRLMQIFVSRLSSFVHTPHALHKPTTSTTTNSLAEVQHRHLAGGVARRQPLPAPVPRDLEDVPAAVCVV